LAPVILRMISHIDGSERARTHWEPSRLSLQHINSYHSELKRFLGFFKGVSTKYLNNYIVWNNLVNFAKETYQEKAALFLNYVLTATLSEGCRDVANRPALPK